MKTTVKPVVAFVATKAFSITPFNISNADFIYIILYYG